MPSSDDRIIATSETIDSLVDFDVPFRIGPDHSISATDDVVPSVLDDEITGEGWEFVSGYSGQYSYSGPIMHNSEFFGGRMAEDILNRPGVYVITVAQWSPEDGGDSTELDVEGWALLRKTD